MSLLFPEVISKTFKVSKPYREGKYSETQYCERVGCLWRGGSNERETLTNTQCTLFGLNYLPTFWQKKNRSGKARKSLLESPKWCGNPSSRAFLIKQHKRSGAIGSKGW